MRVHGCNSTSGSLVLTAPTCFLLEETSCRSRDWPPSTQPDIEIFGLGLQVPTETSPFSLRSHAVGQLPPNPALCIDILCCVFATSKYCILRPHLRNRHHRSFATRSVQVFQVPSVRIPNQPLATPGSSDPAVAHSTRHMTSVKITQKTKHILENFLRYKKWSCRNSDGHCVGCCLLSPQHHLERQPSSTTES